MQILEYQQQGLSAALAQKHAFDAVDGALPSLRRLQGDECIAGLERIQQPGDGRHHIFESAIERKQGADGFGAYAARVVTVAMRR